MVYRDSVRCRKNRLPDGDGRILLGTMIGGGFLTAEERQDLTELARDGLAEHRLARRANALVLLDRGCEDVGRVLLIDDDTIRTWHRLFEADGVDGLAGFKYGGRACQLTLEQQVTLKAWVAATPCRGRPGAWIEHEFGVVSESRSGLIALVHRLGLEHRKPEAVSRKLDPARQQAFIDAYEGLLKTLPDDEAAMFADAVHPPMGRWAAGRPKRSRSRSIRPGSPEHSRRPRSGNRQDPHDRGGDGQRREHDRPAGRDRVSGEADHPCVSGQRPLPSRPGGSGLVSPAGPADPAPFRAGLLPASEPDRAALGADAQNRHPQPMLRHLQRLLPSRARFPAPRCAQQVEHALR